MQAGTPHILSLVALDEALGLFSGVDLDLIRLKSVGLTSLFIELVDQSLGADIELVTPRSPDERGSQVTLRHPEASRLVTELASRGVIVDHRPPDLSGSASRPSSIPTETCGKQTRSCRPFCRLRAAPQIRRVTHTSPRNLAQGDRLSFVLRQISQELIATRQICDGKSGLECGYAQTLAACVSRTSPTTVTAPPARAGMIRSRR